MVKLKKLRFSTISRKFMITLQNELESWNLARFCKIGIQKTFEYQIFEYFWKFCHFLPFFDQNCQIFHKSGSIFKNTRKIKNLVPNFFCIPILHNLLKCQLFNSFCDGVIKIFYEMVENHNISFLVIFLTKISQNFENHNIWGTEIITIF